MPSSYNPRKFNETNKKYLSESLQKFNLAEPIIINADNTIIGGHFRFKILTEKYGLNGYEIDVRVPSRPLSKDEETELNLRLNRNLGEWDFDLLGKIDVSMLQDVGFDSKEIDKATIELPDEKDDFIPEQVEAKSKRGEVYQLGRHWLMCGDSTSKEDVEKLMNGKKADIVFTDPPYGVNYANKTNSIVNQRKDSLVVKNDDLSLKDTQKMIQSSFYNLEATLNDSGVFYVCSPQGGELGLMMMMMMKEAKIECRHMIIWVKDAPVFSMGRLDYDYQHEPILYGWKKNHTHYSSGNFKSSVWSVPRPKTSKLHPTMKPIELIVNAIMNSSKRDDTVQDLFGGSGSTLIASEKTNRICYMMEIDPLYCDVIRRRYEIFTSAN